MCIGICAMLIMISRKSHIDLREEEKTLIEEETTWKLNCTFKERCKLALNLKKEAKCLSHMFAGPLNPGEALMVQYLSKCWRWGYE